MNNQKPCADCIHKTKIEGHDNLACNIDNICHIGRYDCPDFSSNEKLHERAQHFREMVNNMTDEEIVDLYMK